MIKKILLTTAEVVACQPQRLAVHRLLEQGAGVAAVPESRIAMRLVEDDHQRVRGALTEFVLGGERQPTRDLHQLVGGVVGELDLAVLSRFQPDGKANA